MLTWPWLSSNYVCHFTSEGQVDVGFFECAKFLREDSAATDIIQDSDKDILGVELMFYTPALGGLGERRCYLARTPDFWSRFDPSPRLVAESARRAEILRRIKLATTIAELRALIDQTGIKWYVTSPKTKLDWPDEILAHPVFESGGYKVYKFSF